ncbi:MAG: glycosyltransferase family A protein [Acidobacteriota bacterium]|nr:glycosyltransferase family A protein [Acidobacteriota bacterium]
MDCETLTSRESVSVVIPVYNGEKFLGEAITSLLRQTVPVQDIVVIDDGSTDRTPQIATDFGPPVRCYRQERQGPPAARNLGIEKAASEWISLLDADDVWPEDSLRLQLEWIKKDPSLQIVVGYALLWPGPEEASVPVPLELPEEPRLILNLGSALIRRSLFDRLGLLDPELVYCDDWDCFLQAALRRRLVYTLQRMLPYLRDLVAAPIPDAVLRQLRSLPRTQAERDWMEIRTRGISGLTVRTLFKVRYGLYKRSALSARYRPQFLGFPKYMQFIWGMDHWWELPLRGVRTILRRRT